jgi:hypothetical protein
LGEIVLVRKDGRVLTVRRYSALRQCVGLPSVLCVSNHAVGARGQWFREQEMVALNMDAFFADFMHLLQ